MSSRRAAIVLAAGKGKRMKSDLPKVLHKIGDKPMITIILDTLGRCNLDKIVVVIGHEGEMVKDALTEYPIDFVWQRQQLGTGHAVDQARPVLEDFRGITLVAAGDVPFLSQESIEKLFRLHEAERAAATCLSAILDDPTGYGRIIREPNSNLMRRIVEHKDASEEERQVNEINSGTFCFDNQALFEALRHVSNDNAQGEYYLTDTIQILRQGGQRTAVTPADDPDELHGVNSVEQLVELEKRFADRLG